MKILMLVPFLPNTKTSGGQTRWYNIIKYLSKDNEITLFSLIKDDSEKAFIPELESFCKKVRVFKRSKSPWTIRNLALSIFTWYPLLVIRNFSRAEQKAIKKELVENDYDIIHAETFYVMPHIPKTKVPSIQVEQTIWHKVYGHHVKTEMPFFARPFLLIDVFKLKYWEIYYWKKATKLLTVSPDDKVLMEELIPGEKVDVIPNGVDADHYAKVIQKTKSPPRVLYGVTNFEWLQNVEAVDILIDSIWPKIIKEVPNAKLWIAGRMIPDKLVKLAKTRKDIEITESIDDARTAYQGATIMVTPIRGAGGTRLKILEALAARLPVVSTSVGVAGLGLKPGTHAIVSDTNEGLAKAAVDLLKNPSKAKKVGLAGKKFVENNFDWKAITTMHKNIYESAIKNAKTN